MKLQKLMIAAVASSLAGCSAGQTGGPVSLSGIYPELAFYNEEGECGTGAVVPWAGRLWVATYGPHMPYGSSDKLYEISPELEVTVRPESIGGTVANRMIHGESSQLFIGPYAIDGDRNVRVIPYSVMPGRLTGNARHLTDPEHKIYYATMEEGFYEVDVDSLTVSELYRDGNSNPQGGGYAPVNDLLPGVHGKGLYSGQGVLVFSNNGEGTQEALEKFDVASGVLAEWNGADWKVVRRNQFTEVTGPGGIFGNRNPCTDPIWAVGWDYKSVILGVRESGRGWQFYRLPKASHSYDGAHGWNTEWPRIRDVGTADSPDYLMTMHGMFWHFPGTFTSGRSAGIRPRSSYLKVIGDFARWGDRIVFGCDDSAKNEFLNRRGAKGGICGPGQSNSNLWFTSVTGPDDFGPSDAEGAVWAGEQVRAGEASEPFLFAGWPGRMAWLHNGGKSAVAFSFEVDRCGNGVWDDLRTVTVAPGADAHVSFDSDEKGEWIRVKTDADTKATVSFSWSSADDRSTMPSEVFRGLTKSDASSFVDGLLYSLGDNRRALGVLAGRSESGKRSETGYYELDGKLALVRRDDSLTADFIRTRFAVPENVVTVDSSSVLVVDDRGRRWRLPIGNGSVERPTAEGELRVCREVATERDLFSCMGTFYELPAENADGYAKIRPIATHGFRIADYASYRGLLVMTGISPEDGRGNPHVIVSDDGNAAVWAGAIDDLWSLGKPRGHGGPWKDSDVVAGVASDPYLCAFYDRKTMTLSHNSAGDVTFTVEADPTGCGDWMVYETCTVAPGETFRQELPEDFSARWIRFSTDAPVRATAWLEYE